MMLTSEIQWLQVVNQGHNLDACNSRLGKIIAEEESLKAINRLVDRFTIPLLGASADLEAISGEFKEMIHYTIQYISLATLDYRSVW